MGLFSRLFDPGKGARNAAMSKSAEAEMRDFSVYGPGGSATYDASRRTTNVALDETTRNIQNQMFDLGNQSLEYGQDQMALMGGLLGNALSGSQFAGFNPSNVLGPQVQNAALQAIPGFRGVQGPSAMPVNMFSQQPFTSRFAPGTYGMGQGINPSAPSPAYWSGPFSPNRQQARALQSSAMGLLGGATQDIASAEADALSRLRAQARPMEQQAMSDLNENLFGTGRGAVTGNENVELGGGRLAQAFARGLGQADLDRQVQAQGLALQRRQGDLSALGAVSGESRAYQGLDESLRQGMFGRNLGMNQFNMAQNAQQFSQQAQAAGINEQLRQGAFGRELGVNQFGLGQNAQNFQQALAANQFNQQNLANLFNQQMAGAQFGQSEQARQYNQALGANQQSLAAAQQLFGQQLAGAQFGQNQYQQNFANQLAATQYNNQLLGNLFDLGGKYVASDQAMRAGNFQQYMAATQGGLGLNQSVLPLFNMGMASEQQRANALLGASGTFMNAAAATPNIGMDILSGVMGAAGQAGGMAAMFSDERLKDNVQQVDVEPATGLPIYMWDWNDEAIRVGAGGQMPVGLMAQEVQEKYPEAVYKERGYLKINYQRLVEIVGV